MSDKCSGQYIYRLKGSNVEKELEALSKVYHTIYEALKDEYKDVEVFKLFKRAYTEHFTFAEDKIKVKPQQNCIAVVCSRLMMRMRPTGKRTGRRAGGNR